MTTPAAAAGPKLAESLAGLDPPAFGGASGRPSHLLRRLTPATISAPAAPARTALQQDEFELVDFEGTKPIFSRPIFADDEITLAAQAFR
jgi:hypothetical protein